MTTETTVAIPAATAVAAVLLLVAAVVLAPRLTI
jgi:hypothetical protein